MRNSINKVFYNLALVFLFTNSLVGQNKHKASSVIYEIIVTNNLNNAEIDKKAKDIIKGMVNSTESIECRLLFDGYSSVFQQVKKMNLEDDLSYKLASVFIRGINYTNVKEEKRILVKHISDEVFNISMVYNQYDWVITKETKTIGDYVCFKAVTSKEVFNSITNKNKRNDIIAWFAPEIAAPFGPNGIDELPGLILETTTNNIVFYATKIELNYSKENIIKKPEEGKKITEEEYLKLINSKYSSIFDEK